ncbi:MAG TPA: c-type cytochrome [Terracidiphilus sp.]
MSMRIFLPVLAAVISVGLSAAAPQNAKLKIDVGTTPATDGRQMYVSYCASCHGMEGRGDGELATLLKTPPIDLTQLSNNNHGRYPALHVIAVLHRGATASVPGTALMPEWGPIFAKIDRSHSLTATTSAKLLRISNLNRFIKGIQAN